MSIKNLADNLKNLKNKRVLLRLDLNEQITPQGKLLDNFRIQSVLPTIKLLHKAGAKIIVVSHLGRPDGEWQKAFSLKPIAACLAEFLEYKFVEADDHLPTYPIPHVILFTKDITESKTAKLLESQSPQDIVVLENVRFYAGEDKDSAQFAKQLASLADCYVNDAFSVSHRSASSIVGITKLLPACAGPLLEKEIKALDYLLSDKPKKPLVLLMGGIKIADKAQTLRNLGKRAEKILLGGGLANLFLAAQGYEVGINDFDKTSLALAKELLLNFKSKIVLPTDVVVRSSKSGSGQKALLRKLTDIKKSDQIFDIGPESILSFSNILRTAGTVCWNGPMGYFEVKPFRTGTMALAKVIGGLGKRKAYVLAGGGETVASIRLAGQLDHFDHVSTGGGAMLEYLAGQKLPGIEALKK